MAVCLELRSRACFRHTRWWRQNPSTCKLRCEPVLDRVVVIALAHERVGAKLCRGDRPATRDKGAVAPIHGKCAQSERGTDAWNGRTGERVGYQRAGRNVVTACVYVCIRTARAKIAREISKNLESPERGEREHDALSRKRRGIPTTHFERRMEPTPRQLGGRAYMNSLIMRLCCRALAMAALASATLPCFLSTKARAA
jgi:hypothetical protein